MSICSLACGVATPHSFTIVKGSWNIQQCFLSTGSYYLSLSQRCIIKNCEHTGKLKELWYEHLYIHHLDSLCLAITLFIESSCFVTHLLQTSVSFTSEHFCTHSINQSLIFIYCSFFEVTFIYNETQKSYTCRFWILTNVYPYITWAPIWNRHPSKFPRVRSFPVIPHLRCSDCCSLGLPVLEFHLSTLIQDALCV